MPAQLPQHTSPADLDRLQARPDILAQLQTVIDLVARRLGQPFAAFSLFDDRYAYYLVTHGLLPTQLNRSDVLCDVVFGQDCAITTLDASVDSDLRDRPVIRSFGTRFYAGTPVYGPSGQKLGVLCTWGTEPRTTIPDETPALLATSALLIGAIVEASRTLVRQSHDRVQIDQRQSHQARLETALNQASVLTDSDAHIQYATGPLLALMGRRQDELIGLSLSNLLESTAPLTLPQAFKQAAEAGSALQCTGRLRTKGHQYRVVDITIHPLPGELSNERHFGVVFEEISLGKTSNQCTAIRTSLLNGIRYGAPLTSQLETLVNLVQGLVKGDDNLAIVSAITGPGQRQIYASRRSESFVSDLKGHHEFNPAVSICATTAEARQLFSCNDTLDEKRWPNYDWLYFTYDIRSVWCAPILDVNGLINGLVTVFRKEPGSPDKSDLQALEESAEWAGVLLFSDLSATEERDHETISAEYMTGKLHEMTKQCADGEGCFLVALDWSAIFSGDLTASYLEDVISMHLGADADIFRLKPTVWYCLCKALGSHELKGQAAAITKTLTVDKLTSSGHQQAQVKVAYKEARADIHILDQIASVGRLLF